MPNRELFVHLRLHSAYSLAEGTFQISDLVEAVATLGQPAVAVTDTFNNFAALEFSEAAASRGIQPIIGAQVTLSDGGEIASRGEVVLLVQNEIGWRNLSRLVSDGLLESEDVPVVLIEALENHHDGLIVLTGGAASGFIAGAIADGQAALAKSRLRRLVDMMAGRVYIEIQRHGMAREHMSEQGLLSLAYEFNLPLVATNDCYFAKADMAPAHDVLLCISQGATLAQDDRRRETDHHYLKSSAEMAMLFKDLPEAVDNTVVVARRCAFKVAIKEPILPAFPVPDGMTAEDHLRHESVEGLKKRLGTSAFSTIANDPEQKKIYQDRLDFELNVIIKMGFAGYFLIVADFINWSKDNGIAVGPGRGSGAGSLVSYALGITNLDPIRWGLLFERFLNPERVSMPDLDIDFCQERRDEVIAYVQNKYGADKVAQIITFGSLKARAVLRDVGRVMGLPYGQVDRIAKLVPNNPANPVTLTQALQNEDELRKERDADEQVAELVRISCQLEGLYRHASTHAAGLVIGDRPLQELVPLYRDPRSTMAVTQFNMKWVEQAGLVKFDFLGLKTLTVLERTLALIGRRGTALTLDDIPLDDEKTFEMLSRGDAVGVFQLESSGMRDVLRGLKPDRFEDIIAVVALYRPGPMDYIPNYIARKHGREPVDYTHPWLEPVLEETYGIMIYQEQVQQAAQVLAGYTLGGADILRRAMGKKIQAEMDAQRETFINGAAANDISSDLASRIFDKISAFAGYGFNKSHAAAYALIAWQTAWLKANYPAEFLAATMTLDRGNTDKLSVFKQDCTARDITVLPPCVNASEAEFIVEENEEGLAIRYALGAIRNVGIDAMAALVAERNERGRFTSIDDFSERMAGVISRRFLENLIKAGAFDGLVRNREQLMAGLDEIVGHGQAARHERESDQDNLFGGAADTRLKIVLPDLPEGGEKDRLEQEFSALGLYISAHPLDAYASRLEEMGVIKSRALAATVQERGSGCRVTMAGIVGNKQFRTSARGNRYAFAQFTDQTGGFEVTLFSEVLDASRVHLDAAAPLLVKADAREEKGDIRLLAQSITPLDSAVYEDSKAVEVRINYYPEAPAPEPLALEALKGIKEGLARDGTGKAVLKICIPIDEKIVTVDVPGRHRLSADFRQMVKTLPGVDSIRDIT
jgi:DNA polymerase-3 subunit alpha